MSKNDVMMTLTHENTFHLLETNPQIVLMFFVFEADVLLYIKMQPKHVDLPVLLLAPSHVVLFLIYNNSGKKYNRSFVQVFVYYRFDTLSFLVKKRSLRCNSNIRMFVTLQVSQTLAFDII